MFFAVWAIFIFLLFGALIKKSRRVLYDDFSTNTDMNEYKRQLERLSRIFILPSSHGKGVDAAPAKKYINRAYRIIKRKLIRGEELYEFERWLYDNHYLFSRAFDSCAFEGFSDLPHAGAAPRIVLLARAMVALSEGDVPKERIDAALATINGVSALTYKEVKSLEDAITFAVLEKLAAVSRKCLYYHKMMKIAVRAKNVVKEYASNNIYIYYTIKKNPALADNLKGFMDENAKKYDNVDYAFSALVVENNVLTAALVNSLTHITENAEDKLRYMPVFSVLSADKTFAQSDIATKKLYLEQIDELSDKINVTEKEFAESLLKLAEKRKTDASILLFEGGRRLLNSVKGKADVICKERKITAEKLYVALNVTLTLIFSVAVGAAAMRIDAGIAVSILGAIGMLCPAYFLSNSVTSLFVKQKPICRTNFTDIPAHAKTEVIVPIYVCDEDVLRKNIAHIARVAAGNVFSNVKFTLLLDFKASNKENDEGDNELLKILKTELPENISAAVRKRTQTNGRYCGYERKRGAVMQYAEYLATGNDGKFTYLSSENFRPEYFIVLDADSELEPQTVLRAVNTFLHPINAHYDLLAFSGKTNAYSIKTPYSKRFSGEAKREAYPEYDNLFFNLTGNALFCGKGIFRLSSYYDKLNNRLPEGRILSHDLIEGALLETGLAGVSVYEDAPLDFRADEDRRLRWARGDIQLLPYLNLTKSNNNYKKMRIFYRYLMYLNAFSVFYQPYILCLFLLSAFLNLPYLAIFTAAIFSAEFIVNLAGGLVGVFTTRRARYYLSDVINGLLFLVSSAILLPYKTVVNLWVFMSTLFKMLFTKKGLLNWKPFCAGEDYVDNVKEVPNKTRKTLLCYAADTYRYFTAAQNPNLLIADNFAVMPAHGAAKYTSPTDIGFSILAEASAYLLDLCEKSDAEKRAEKLIDAALKLKKWNGHLYNWYSVESKKPLEPFFVSSVDSANFIACVMTVSEIFGNDIKKKIDKYLSTVDFKALFDGNRGQFYIGYNGRSKRFEGHYDIMVSEARLLCYLGVCFGLPASLWDNLARDYTGKCGNTPMSWGGTAFEYLLPDLFLRAPQGSLLGLGTKRAVRIMRRTKCKGLFGMSESGYFDFDDCGNYKYKAFGADSLSLKSELNRCVIAPYSSFLMLPYAPHAVIKNLKRLEKMEGYGEYGFYEALDFTRAPRIVAEYMAHHAGMSLAAMANYLAADALVRAFENNVSVAASRILLCESPNENKTLLPEKNKFVYEEKCDCDVTVNCAANNAEPSAVILKNGAYTVLLDDFGCGYSQINGIAVNRFERDYSRFYGGFFYVTEEDGSVNSPCRAPLDKEANYSVTFKKTEAIYVNASLGLTQTVYAPAFFNGEMRRLKIENNGDSLRKCKVSYFSELCLNYRVDYAAHPAYSNLFVETEVTDGVLYATRRKKEGGIYAALYVSGAKANYISNRYLFLGRGREADNPACVFNGISSGSAINGTVLDPCLAFVAEVEIPAGGFKEIDVFTAVSDSYEVLTADVKRARNPHFAQLIKKIPYIEDNNASYALNAKFTEYAARLIPELIYTPYPREVLYNACRLHKIFTRITDNFTRKTLLLKYNGDRYNLKQAVNLLRLLLSAGISVSLVIWYGESDGYYTPVHAEIMRTLTYGAVGRDIFLLTADEISFEDLTDICFCDFSRYSDVYAAVCNPQINKLNPLNYDDKVLLESGEGYFTENGYVVKPFVEKTLLPYSNVICGKTGGIIAGDGGGYTYYGNSRESKLTRWSNDLTVNAPSERLFFTAQNILTDLLSGAEKHSHGKTEYIGEGKGFTANTEIYVIGEGGAKVYEVTIRATERLCGSVMLCLNLTLGAVTEKDYIFYKIEDGIFEAVNLKNGISGYLRADGAEFVPDLFMFSRGGKIPSAAMGNTSYAAVQKVNIEAGGSAKFYFVFGGDFRTVAESDYTNIAISKRQSLDYFDKLNTFKICTGDTATDILFNDCLAYQLVSARVNGKTSLYQAGGATGFRDILQDALSLIYIDAERVKEIILDAANHVYAEGDVMHWWHGEKHGVRTRISDDRLFLPYLVTEYIAATGNAEILEIEVKYLDSKPLTPGEASRYENPPYLEKTDTLLLHLEKIMESAYKTGENGLLMIGGGDWNDALNAVGTGTAGESVWLTEFYVEVANRMRALYGGKEAFLWFDRADRLKKAVEKTFTGRQFKRLVTAGGEWLGDGYGKEIKLDVISQAWASLAGIGDKKYRDLALNAVKNTLIDKHNGEILLLTPPFDGIKYYGYISLYPKGLRENGGQYTHGAVWYLMALIKENRVDEAYELFNMINPVAKCSGKKETLKYMGEPYVIAADVYSAKGQEGRAGWTWYTGSASWCYKLILEGFLGVRLKGGNLAVNPNLPSAINHVDVEYRFKNSTYKIKMVRTGRKAVFENGVEIGGDLVIPLRENENRRFVVNY